RLTSRARLKNPPKIGRLKLSSTSTTTNDISDALQTTLSFFEQSSDAFPPLKSVVGGVIALWDVAKRAKHSKADARGIALRAQDILQVMADAVSDSSAITPGMQLRIERFTVLLNNSRRDVESIALANSVTRVMRLNRDEEILQDIKRKFNEAHADFLLASALRLEGQQAALALKHQQMHLDVKKVSLIAETLAPDIAHLVLLTRITVVSSFFWPSPDASIQVASLPTL
ncbi:hypothetical protein C8R46DRAFT_1078049, partial [Mycena filopes]